MTPLKIRFFKKISRKKCLYFYVIAPCDQKGVFWPQILVKLRPFSPLESSEPKLLLQRPPLKSDFPCKWAEKNICIFFDFVLLSSDYLEIQFFREIEFSTFTDICFRYQGTLRVQKPLRSRMGKFDSRFYGSGTMWVRNDIELSKLFLISGTVSNICNDNEYL